MTLSGLLTASATSRAMVLPLKRLKRSLFQCLFSSEGGAEFMKPGDELSADDTCS